MFAWKALLSKQARVIQASKTQRRCTCLSVKKINASERKQRKKDNILRFLIKLRPKEQEVTLFSCLFRLFDFRASGQCTKNVREIDNNDMSYAKYLFCQQGQEIP